MSPSPSGFTLLPRNKKTDKSRYGHVLVLAGSRGMSGAPQLVSRACLKSGAGLVTVGVPKSIRAVFAKASLAEVMCLELPETSAGTLSAGAYSKIVSFIRARKINALAVGPGLTHQSGTSALVRRLVKSLNIPIVLDADGLNAYRSKSVQLKQHHGKLVVTPHRKEFERLFSKSWPERQDQRAMLAKKLSRLYDVTIVLKGPRTLVVQGAQIYENRTGNPGMAKAGSGDVLTGILAAFVAQGLSPFKAARWAVYFHGKAADLAVKSKSELGLLAGDIIEYLPQAFVRKK
jgi:hydroxyethylthiazole kinase-like uncharacterized protein yjeF